MIIGVGVAVAHFGAASLAWRWWDVTALATQGAVPFWVQVPSLVLGLPLVVPWLLTGQMKTMTILHSGNLTIDFVLALTVFDSLTWGIVAGALASRRNATRG